MAIYLPILTSFNDKGVKQAEKGFKDLDGFTDKSRYALKKLNAGAIVAFGAIAAGLGDAVKAAIEDEAAQKKLEDQIKRTTGASDIQLQAVEDFIKAQGRQVGFTDDELRPSLGRLIRATEDVSKAQDLAEFSMDVARGTGKNLETVVSAVEKAYGGNMTALQKLSPEVRDMIKDGDTLEEVMTEMSKTFGGAAASAAETAAGKFAIMKIQLQETKESIGAALMPAVEAVLPFLQRMADWAEKNPDTFKIIALAIAGIAGAIVAINVAMSLNPFALIAAGVGVFVAALIIGYKKFEIFRDIINMIVNQLAGNFEFMANAFITMVNLVIKGINLIKPGADIATLGSVSIGRLGGTSNSGGNTGSINAFEQSQKIQDVADIGFGIGGMDFSGASPTGKVKTTKPAELKAPTGTGGPLGMGFGDVNINVQAGLVSTGAQVGSDIIDAILAAQRKNGTVFAAA